MTEEKRPSIENLMTIDAYARMMGKERRTIYNWIKEGIVQRVPFLGKQFIDKSTYRNN